MLKNPTFIAEYNLTPALVKKLQSHESLENYRMLHEMIRKFLE